MKFIIFTLVLTFSTVCVAASKSAQSMRGKRYCELVAVKLVGFSELKITTYSTLRHSDCGQKAFQGIDVDQVKNQLRVTRVKTAGPRFVMMDTAERIDPEKMSDDITVNGLRMSPVRSFSMEIRRARSGLGAPYKANTAKQSIQVAYFKGTRIYELVDPDGQAYVMNSYSREKDQTLQLDTLKDLGEKLDLPEGWTFQTRVLKEEIKIKFRGEITAVRDELMNSYLKLQK